MTIGVGDLTHSNALVSWYDGSIMEQLIDAPVKVRNEKPILFSGEMVKAILDGRKTQTRRIIKPQPGAQFDFVACPNWDFWWSNGDDDSPQSIHISSPHGIPGDRLWVKETFYQGDGIAYRADGEMPEKARTAGCKWKPSIFMPRKASRITLEITNVRVERLQDISEEDAKAEGIEQVADPFNEGGIYWRNYIYHLNTPRGDKTGGVICGFKDPRKSYRSLWDSINGLGSWEKSPWIWAITFKRV